MDDRDVDQHSMTAKDSYSARLEDLDRLLEESTRVTDLERHINDTINAHRRHMLITGLEEFVKLLLDAADKTVKLENVPPEHILVNSQYRAWSSQKKMRQGYAITILPDLLLSQGVSTLGPTMLGYYDNPHTRIGYLDEFKSRYRRLKESLIMGELDDLTAKTPQEILHMINGAHGELLERLRLQPSSVPDRLLGPVLPRLVTVRVIDSRGNPITGAQIHYYQNRWRRLKPLADSKLMQGIHIGYIDEEAEALKVKVTHLLQQHSLEQDLSCNRIFIFQTRQVQAQTLNSEGEAIQGTIVYANSGDQNTYWTPSDEQGIATFELFPGRYRIQADLNGFKVSQVLELGECDEKVTLQTGSLWCIRDNCVQIQVDGWQGFTQGMELPPGRYWVKYSDGTPDTITTVEPGKINIIR